jgi:isopenicillin-N N-acyltransferase-like protein
VSRRLREKTARAAYDVIARSPIGSGHHYFVADAKEALALEASGTRRKPLPVDTQYCHANHCLDADIEARSKVPPTKRRTTGELLEADLARERARPRRRLAPPRLDRWLAAFVCTTWQREAPHGVRHAAVDEPHHRELYVQQGFINNVKPERYQL